MTDDFSDTGRPAWDAKRASELLDAIVLVGLTYVDATGNVTDQFQYYGMVIKVDEGYGVAIECQSETFKGDEHWLPPDLNAFRPAAPGEYRLRSTGEVIRDPDYLVSYEVKRPSDQPQ